MVEKERITIHQREANEDIGRMVNATERAVFSFLHNRINSKIPGAIMRYESVHFQVKTSDGSQLGTVPDFLILKPNGNEVYVEVTSGDSNTKNKARDQVMRHFPEVRYVVLHRDVIQNIENKNPGEKLVYTPNFGNK